MVDGSHADPAQPVGVPHRVNCGGVSRLTTSTPGWPVVTWKVAAVWIGEVAAFTVSTTRSVASSRCGVTSQSMYPRRVSMYFQCGDSARSGSYRAWNAALFGLPPDVTDVPVSSAPTAGVAGLSKSGRRSHTQV